MKREYTTPVMECETFVPDEYVAACWRIKCNVPSGTGYYETNGEPGYQKGYYIPILGWVGGDEEIASGTGCGTWHVGVESEGEPTANAMWQESRTDKYYPVYYWEDHSAGGWGQTGHHFSKVEDAEWETNPNAS